MKGEQEIQKVGEVKPFVFIDSDFPPLKQEGSENKGQKQIMTPAPEIPLKSKDKSVFHFDFGVPMEYIQPAVSNSSQSAATSGKPATVPRPPVVMPTLKKGSQKKDKPVFHTMEYIQPAVSNRSQSAATSGKPATVSRPPVVMPKLKKGSQKKDEPVYHFDFGVPMEYIQPAVNNSSQSAAAVKDEKEQKGQTEKLLAAQLAETKRLKEELSQAQKKLEEEKLKREVEMLRLLAEHSRTTSMMKAAAMKAQEDLENERSQWLQERSSIQAALKSLKESIDKTVEEKETFITDVMSKLHDSEQAEKKSKKRSLWKRFKQLFKRS